MKASERDSDIESPWGTIGIKLINANSPQAKITNEWDKELFREMDRGMS